MSKSIRTAIAPAVLAAAACLIVAVPAPGATNAGSQAFFRTQILNDAATASAVKDVLRNQGGFIDPTIIFSDLTGDGRQDAIVTVDTGGAAGAIAVYVFSTDRGTHPPGALKPVYRGHGFFRAAARVEGLHTLVVTTPLYSRGDEVCCARRLREQRLRWSRTHRHFRVVSTRTRTAPR